MNLWNLENDREIRLKADPERVIEVRGRERSVGERRMPVGSGPYFVVLTLRLRLKDCYIVI